ncbi:hypothetical protein EK21DRAFT_70264, partial [Setomelanomma holmii]
MVVKVVGHPNLDGVKHEIRNEFRFHWKLSQRQCPHILDVCGRSVRPRELDPQLGYLYMSWAPYGSLYDLLRKLQDDPKQVDHRKQLPEPYLWHIFRALVEGLYVCQTGLTVAKDQPARDTKIKNLDLPKAPGWRPIVNPDIKLPNVVLAQPLQGYYPAYKAIKMIDFGLAFDDNRYSNEAAKTARGNIGTPGKHNLEQYSPLPMLPTYYNERIDIRSNIFNVGLIMISLMEGRNRTSQQGTSTTVARVKHDDTYDRANRPRLSELLYKTKIGIKRWEKAYDDVSGAPGEVPERWTWTFDDEEFMIGDAAPTHWPGPARKRR